MNYLTFIIGILFCGQTVLAQSIRTEMLAKSCTFSPPMDGEMYVSGTFGEPRPNHYHAGLDLKTKGQTGWTVRSAEEGYISRIKVSATGYGNALYINHPCGLTTVYAHLDKFVEPVAEWVKTVQYEKKSFEVDTVLPDKRFIFKKGERIAFSGNTGGSAGPHLHFEVRETYRELVLNPMAFGFKVKDQQSPQLDNVKIYPVVKSFYEHQGISVPLKNIAAGMWTAGVVNVPAGTIMFSVQAFDRQDLTPEHKNGIPAIKMLVNDSLVFYRRTDTIDFSLTKYTHSMIDYCDKVRDGKDFYLTTWLPGNLEKRPYSQSPADGRVSIQIGEEKKIELQLIDFHGNTSVAVFKIKGIGEKRDTVAYLSGDLSAGKKILPGATVFWTKESFYDLIPDKIRVSDKVKSPYSKTYYIFKNEVFPIHKSLEFVIHEWTVPDNLKDKLILVGENVKDRKKTGLVERVAADLVGSVSEASEVYLDVDTIAPQITLLNYQKNTGTFTQKKIDVRISDDLSGIKSYAGYIDGQWVLFEYDAKNALLTHHFDERIKGEHELLLIITDMRNNIAETRVKFKK